MVNWESIYRLEADGAQAQDLINLKSTWQRELEIEQKRREEGIKAKQSELSRQKRRRRVHNIMHGIETGFEILDTGMGIAQEHPAATAAVAETLKKGAKRAWDVAQEKGYIRTTPDPAPNGPRPSQQTKRTEWPGSEKRSTPGSRNGVGNGPNSAYEPRVKLRCPNCQEVNHVPQSLKMEILRCWNCPCKIRAVHR